MAKLRNAVALSVLLGSASWGCSSSTGEHHDTGAVADAGGSGTPGSESDAAVSGASLKAPVITQITKMAGGLHVVWKNEQTNCDSIEGERKGPGEAYKVVFTVPDGSVNNKHDAPLTAGTMYTYRLRCMKGTASSPYSNEKSEKA